MGKKLMQFRVCDRCTKETEATVMERLAFNGETFSLDLCERHSENLHDEIGKWTQAGTKIGTASRVFDGPRLITGPVIVDLDAKKKTPTVDLDERPSVVPRALPDYPMTAGRWNIPHHAHERLEERGIEEAAALHAAEQPEITLPSRSHPDCQVRTRGDVSVVVDPFSVTILTAYPSTEDEDAAERPQLRRAGTR